MAIGNVPGQGDPIDDEGIFAEINITPLTDIFLVLLIIFMVTSSVMADAGARSGLRVNLPKGATKEVNVGQKDLTIAIAQDGRMVVRGQVIEPAELTRMLTAAHAENPDTQVIIQADEATHHGRVVSVMELAKSIGLHRLAIATRRSK
jgi:biopolymer transport protein ExbD